MRDLPNMEVHCYLLCYINIKECSHIKLTYDKVYIYINMVWLILLDTFFFFLHLHYKYFSISDRYEKKIGSVPKRQFFAYDI